MPITGGGASSLDGLSDVVIVNPSLSHVLHYDGTQWENLDSATDWLSQYLYLPGRTGGQVIGSGAHTGGNTVDITHEGRLMLGDALSGVNYTIGRVLDIRSNTINNSTTIQIVPSISALSGTASGIINTLLLNVSGTYGYTAGSFTHRAFFFNGNIVVGTGVTLLQFTAGNFQCVADESGGAGTVGINSIRGLFVDARHANFPASGHTATSLFGIEIRVSNRQKAITNVYGLFIGNSSGGSAGAVTNFQGIFFDSALMAAATVATWSAIRMVTAPAGPPISWFFDVSAVMNSRHAGKFSIGHVATPTAWVHLGAGVAGINGAPLKFITGVLTTVPEVGAVEFVGERFYKTPTSLERDTIPGVLYTSNASAQVTNTLVETTLVGAGVGDTTLNPNFFISAKTIRIRASGWIDTAAVAGTLQIRVRLGGIAGTVILDTTAVVVGNNLAARYWNVDAIITCRTVGVGGTVIGQSAFQHMLTPQGNPVWWEMVNIAPIVLDTTVAQLVEFTAQWGTADAANIIECTNFILEVLN